MSDAIIQVEGLGKKYRLGLARHDTLRDRLAHALHAPFRRRPPGGDPADFWALRDVSFEVRRGEVLGIIGRNGAGKSTLLKVLSRITEPTTGRVTLCGRVASLLEVGTGFHPELSGRENVYLNGAILGMGRAEIRRKFDEIVAFAEVEKFLDTPVKHYSSGMYVRLAFAVAAHLEPEILIVDEVLAVGDAAFQQKCLGKMEQVAGGGRTVLFVSHHLPSVRRLCGSAILLAAGRIQAGGSCRDVLGAYEQGLAGAGPVAVPQPPPDLRERAYVTGVQVESLEGNPLFVIPVGRPWRVRVGLRVARRQDEFVAAVGLKAADGTAIQTAWIPPQRLEPGDYEAVFTQDRVVLEAGTYTLLVGLTDAGRGLQQFEAVRFEIGSENIVGYYPATAGVGAVLNSMRTEFRRL